MIKLDLRTGLPKVRAAWDAGQLQRGACYSDPCAIGAMATPEERAELDEFPSGTIGALWLAERVDIPNGQATDFSRLQDCFESEDDAVFESMLTRLEEKYTILAFHESGPGMDPAQLAEFERKYA